MSGTKWTTIYVNVRHRLMSHLIAGSLPLCNCQVVIRGLAGCRSLM